MKRFRYHPEARAELRAAVRVHEAERPGRGLALDAAVARVERRLQRFPGSAPRWPETGTHEIRVARVRRTPYLLVYMILPDQLVVLAIAHSRQKPGYWQERAADVAR